MTKGQYRISGRYMQTRFKRVGKTMGWDCESKRFVYRGGQSGNLQFVGHTFIERAPCEEPLYRVMQITTVSGGGKQLSDNYTSSELAAWFDGILKAHETLCELHANILRSVDSGRGNEIFAALWLRQIPAEIERSR